VEGIPLSHDIFSETAITHLAGFEGCRQLVRVVASSVQAALFLFGNYNLLKRSGGAMKFSKGMFVIAIIVPLIAGLNGCSSSMIGVREGSDQVHQADAILVGGCQSKGKVNVSVLTKVGVLFGRSSEDVEANLLQMARNNALDAGADTLVKGESQEFGKRTFEMYKCQP
jgi:hypothetical protein